MFEVNSYMAQFCCRVHTSRAYPYGRVHEATLLDTYGKEYEDTLVVEGGVVDGTDAAEPTAKP